jgi:HAD superfamily hydrolase (TIGR01549 family)
MVCAKAVIFDYIGTLVNCGGYTMEASRNKLHAALTKEGLDVDKDKFLESYILTHEKYRKVRYENLREVTNAIWVAEALFNLGFTVTADDVRVKAALNVFFKDFIDTLKLRAGAKKLIKQAKKKCKVALISNFTYSPVIYSSLRKLEINPYFNEIVISEENGWRKPSSQIFQDTLDKLQLQAKEAIYIGDSPIEDIKGAKQAGLKTIFVPSQFYTLKDLVESQQKPDLIEKDLRSISENLDEIISIKQIK